MAEELQSLLEKINSEGIKKAEAEKESILAAARAEADAIRAEAKKNAADMIADAEKECTAMHSRTVASLHQSYRDILLQLKSELLDKISKAVGENVSQSLTPDFMAQIISQLYTAFAADPAAEVSVRCAVKDTAALDAALRGALAGKLAQAEVSGVKSITAGMEVSFDGGKCYFDFTEAALAELLNSYIGEKLAVIFQADK